MKKLNKLAIIAFLVAGLFLLGGCSKVKILKVEKVLDGGSAEFTLAPQTSLDYDVLKSQTLDIEALLKPHNLTLDNVTSLKVESVEIQLKDSTVKPVTFDIVDNTSLEVGTPSLPLVMMASKNPVPHTGLTTLGLDVNQGVDIIPYAKANNVTYHIKLKLNKQLDHEVKMKAIIKWKVVGEI